MNQIPVPIRPGPMSWPSSALPAPRYHCVPLPPPTLLVYLGQEPFAHLCRVPGIAQCLTGTEGRHATEVGHLLDRGSAGPAPPQFGQLLPWGIDPQAHWEMEFPKAGASALLSFTR